MDKVIAEVFKFFNGYVLASSLFRAVRNNFRIVKNLDGRGDEIPKQGSSDERAVKYDDSNGHRWEEVTRRLCDLV